MDTNKTPPEGLAWKKKPRLTAMERLAIETGLDAGKTPYAIARELGRPPKTVMREIRGRAVESDRGTRGPDHCDTVDVIRSMPFRKLPPLPRQPAGAAAGRLVPAVNQLDEACLRQQREIAKREVRNWWGQSLNWWGQSPIFSTKRRDAASPSQHPPKTGGLSPAFGPKIGGLSPAFETVSEENDEKERTIFRLRTIEGLDATKHPEWIPALERFVGDGLLRRKNDTDHPVYALTERGTEVCDAILEEII